MKKILLLAIACIAVANVFGTTYYWVGGVGSSVSPKAWNAAANWSTSSGGTVGTGNAWPGYNSNAGSDIAIFDGSTGNASPFVDVNGLTISITGLQFMTQTGASANNTVSFVNTAASITISGDIGFYTVKPAATQYYGGFSDNGNNTFTVQGNVVATYNPGVASYTMSSFTAVTCSSSNSNTNPGRIALTGSTPAICATTTGGNVSFLNFDISGTTTATVGSGGTLNALGFNGNLNIQSGGVLKMRGTLLFNSTSATPFNQPGSISGAGVITPGAAAYSIWVQGTLPASYTSSSMQNMTFNFDNTSTATSTVGSGFNLTRANAQTTIGTCNAAGLISGTITITTGTFHDGGKTIKVNADPIFKTGGANAIVTGTSKIQCNRANTSQGLCTPGGTFQINNLEIINANNGVYYTLGSGTNLTINGTLTLSTPTAVTSGIDASAATLTFQNGNTPIVINQIGTAVNRIKTDASTNLKFGSTGNTAGNAFTIPNDVFTTAPSITSFTVNRDNALTFNNQALTVSGATTITAGTLAMATTLTTNGATTVNGTFQLNTGGSATGSGTWTYGGSSTLAFNSSSAFNVNPADVYWPSSSGPTNITILQGGLNLGNTGTASRTVTGTFQTAAAVALQNSSVLTLNGTVQINNGGSFSNAPLYGSSSTLIYNSGGSYAIGNEWTGTGLSAGTGVPKNVTIQNSTTLTFPTTDRGCVGNFNISSGGATLNATSGNLYVAGNFTNNGTFTHNNRTVYLNGASGTAQTIAGTLNGTTTSNCFYNVQINNTSGGVTLNSPVTVTNTFTITSGIVTTTSTNLLSVTNTANTAVAATTSFNTTAFVNGPIAWTLPNGSSTSTYIFPVGSGSNYYPLSLASPTTSTNGTVAKVQVVLSSSAGVADLSTLSSISTGEYWSITASVGNITGGQISLTRTGVAIGTFNRIGASATLNGTYASIGGTVSDPSINTSNTISTINAASSYYFVYAVVASSNAAISTITGGLTNASGYIGQTLTINGANFTDPVTITFNGGTSISTTFIDATKVTVVVPTSATTGNIVLTSNSYSTAGYAYTILGYISAADGDWNASKTWSADNSTSYVPTAGSKVTINNAVTVNGTVSSNPTSVTINTGSLTFGASGVLGVTNFTISSGTSLVMTSGGNLNIASGGSLTNNSSGTFTQGTGTLNFAGAGSLSGITTLNNVTIAGAVDISGTTINGNLTLQGTATTTTTAATTIGGNLTIGDGTNAATFTAAGFNLTVTGATTVANGSTLTINSATGTKTFTGLVTVNAGGVWNNSGNSAVALSGGISNAGAFTAGTGVYTFNTSTAQSLSGTLTIPSVTVTSPTVLTNNGILTVSTALIGTGGLTQGYSATLNIGGTSTISTLTATATGNTVNYNASSTQTVNAAATYYNLTLSGTSAKTLQAGTTAISNNVSLQGTASTTTVVALSIGGNLSVGDGTNIAGFTVAGFDLTVTGTTTIANAGTLTISNATGNKSFSGLVTINGGGTWNNSGNSAIALNGGLTIGGASVAFTPGTGITTVTDTLTTNGAFSLAAGTIAFNTNTATLAGSASPTFNNLTINASSTLTVNVSTVTVAGTFTNNNTSTTGLVANTSTFIFTGTSKNIAAGSATTTTSFNNLTISGTTTFSGTSTGYVDNVGGNLMINDGGALTIANTTITVSGTTTIGSTTGATLTLSSTSGTKTFTGLVTVNAGGTWNNSGNSAITLSGGISNAGAFTAGTGIYTFNTNNQALTGTLSIPSVTVTGVTLTNNGVLTVATALTGTGGLTQGSNATLNIGGTSGITTLTASATGNTVNYTGTSQTLVATNYVNLDVSGATTPTYPSGTIGVAGAFTPHATIFPTQGTVNFNGTSQNIPATKYFSLTCSGSGTKTAGGNFSLSTSLSAGTLTIADGVILNMDSYTLTTLNSSGSLTTSNNSGTGTGILKTQATATPLPTGRTWNFVVEYNNATGGQTISAGTYKTLTLSNSTGTNTSSGAVNATTLNTTAGGSWDMGSTGTLGGTLSTVNHNGTLKTQNTTSPIANSKTYGGTGTIEFNGTSAQAFTASTATQVNNLTISNTSGLTLTNQLTINGTLTINSNCAFNVGSNTLILNGPAISGSGTLSTTSSSSLSFGGTNAGPLNIPSSVTALNNLTLNNTNITPATLNVNSGIAIGGTLALTAGTLADGGNTITLAGSITGTGTHSGTGKILMTGSGKTISSATLQNLEIAPGAGNTISLSEAPTIKGALTITSGSLTTGTNTLSLGTGASATIAPKAVLNVSGSTTNFNGQPVTVQSTAAGDGMLLHGSSSISGATNVTLQRYHTSNQRAWRLLSNPLNQSITWATLAGSSTTPFDLSGAGSNASGETYDPVSNTFNGYTATTDLIPATSAYTVFIRGKSGEGIGAKRNYPSGPPSKVTVGVTGTLNTGNLTISVKAGQYYLIPNPFAAPISVYSVLNYGSNSNYIKNSAIYYWDATTGSTDPKVIAGGYGNPLISAATAGSTGDYIIPIMGAFFVEAYADGSITIPAAAVFSGTGSGSMVPYGAEATQKNHIGLSMLSDTLPFDYLNIYFNDKANTTATDPLDFKKMNNTNLNFYSIGSDNTHLSIDERPFNTQQTIPLGLQTGLERKFSIKVNALHLPAGSEAYLIDNALGTQNILSVGSTYDFAVSSDSSTKGNTRFAIAFKPIGIAAAIPPADNTVVSMYPNPAHEYVQIHTNSPTAATISIYNSKGVLVKTATLPAAGSVTIDAKQWAGGVYVLHINNGQQSITKKLIIN